MASTNHQLNVRLKPQEHDMLAALQDRYGLSQAGIITLLLHDRCAELKQREGFSTKRTLKDL